MDPTANRPPAERAARRRRWPRRIFLALVLGLSCVLVVLLVLFFRGPSVPGRAVLIVDLRQALPERSEDDLIGFFSGPGIDLLGLRRVFLAAAGDQRVLGVVLEVGGEPMDLALAEEISGMVKGFRRSGKFALACSEGPTGAGYLVSAAADEVVLYPSTELNLVGISAQTLFLGDALRRQGLQFDLVRAGEYKGAFEQLTAGRPTPAFTQALSETVDSLFATLVEEIGASRKLDPDLVRKAIDEAPLLPAAALEEKLVDRVSFHDEIPGIAALRAGGGSSPEPFGAADYLEAVGERGEGARIAVVRLCGLLVDSPMPSLPLLGETTAAEEVAEAFRQVRKDDSIKGVVLRIDSPGGSMSAAERIWREVDVTRKHKPVVASLGGSAASGGYYAACAADHVIARAGTITGSIGVFGGKLVLKGLLDKEEVRVEDFGRGRRAGMFSLTRPFTDDERASLERAVREGYRRFVDRVAVGRKKPFEEAERLARGRVWTGRQALENGLVDELGGFDEAVARVKSLARIPPGEDADLVPFPPRPTILDLLRGRRRPSSLEAKERFDPRALERLLVQCGLDGRTLLALAPFRLILQ